jgi:hypothetical protein
VAAWWRDEARREEERAGPLSWEVVAAEVAARRRPAWGEDAGERRSRSTGVEVAQDTLSIAAQVILSGTKLQPTTIAN